MTENDLNDLKRTYKNIKPDIIERLKLFRENFSKMDNNDIFAELSFCTLTPQSKAKSCWKCIESIRDSRMLYEGCADELRNSIKGVRFHNNKSAYIVHNRDFVFKMDFKKFIIENSHDIINLRKWLVDNIKGYSYKEAGHFLRNIGLGSEIAILDRHILKNLVLFGVIDEIPKSLNEKKYLETEAKMSSFSKRIKIPMDHLDILLWYKQTGEIFK
ncbi:MAG TPA: N-glycosylase/DNA lyase [Clostridiales bacterium]|nr:N-glycosylase/DNA lyase [Clostridiales bacterium]HQP69490.1 N-glycosylase/DNA lyase [Clostridiales bacterium]